MSRVRKILRMKTPIELVNEIWRAATPVLAISGVGGRWWKRNVAKGSRIGPWLQASYKVVDRATWQSPGACLYLVGANDGGLRYVGISRNGLRHRWRESPAVDAQSGMPLPERQLFHSQCWKHIQQEFLSGVSRTFVVRSILSPSLCTVLEQQGPPLSAFLPLRDDDEGLVAAVERWICNRHDDRLASWNVAMTGNAAGGSR